MQEQIVRREDLLQQLNTKKEELTQINICGLHVCHKHFGRGAVCEQDALTVTVAFGEECKRFAIPNAFYDGFLSTQDETMNLRLVQHQQIEVQIRKIKGEIAAIDHAVKTLK